MICFIRMPGHRGGVEGQLAGEHLVGHDAEAVQVGPAVDVALAGRLLRAHEGRRADGHTDAGERGARGGRERLGDPEVGDHHPAPGPLQQDVVGFDVAVDDRHRMGGAEGVGRLHHDAARFFDRKPAPAADPGRHRLAVHVAHDEVHQTLALADAVNRDDMGMGEPGGRLRFAGEPLADILLESELGRQHLDGDPALEPLVAGAVHYAHAAPPNLAFDRVRAPKASRETGGERFLA